MLLCQAHTYKGASMLMPSSVARHFTTTTRPGGACRIVARLPSHGARWCYGDLHTPGPMVPTCRACSPQTRSVCGPPLVDDRVLAMLRPWVPRVLARSTPAKPNIRHLWHKSDKGKDETAQATGETSTHRPRSHNDMAESVVSGAAKPIQFVRAHAGKSAVTDNRRRSREGASKALRAASGISPEGQASMRADYAAPKHPLPELHTFSDPSTSFNASSWVSSGVVPPLAGRSAAGIGEGYHGRPLERKKTALILPGQGSQYVTMSRDLYETYPAARRVWEEAEAALTAFMEGRRLDATLPPNPLRNAFESKLQELSKLEPNKSLKPGWLLDLVFSGNQLELTRSENATPAILACTLAMLAVLREEFGVDFVEQQVSWAAGHGSGTYASLVAAGCLQQEDALRALRYRGLEAMHCLVNHPVLFPEGSTPPVNIYETWGFANAGAGKGSELLVSEPSDDLADIAQHDGSSRTWKGTQVSAVVVRPGRLEDALREVEEVQRKIRNGEVQGIASDEFVAVANINSRLQIVLSGTRVGVMYACDRLRFKMYGARAVNLPVAGPFHTTMVSEAAKKYRSLVDVMPIGELCPALPVVSSCDGRIFENVDEVRSDLADALDKPVYWVKTIHTLVEQGVQRFICVGPGRACAHQLSKELACYEKAMADAAGPNAQELVGTLDEPQSDFEVWSVSTTQGVRARFTHPDGAAGPCVGACGAGPDVE